MKRPPESSDDEPDDRFVDAALREYAHLGTEGRDEELVHRILTATVDRSRTPEVDRHRTRTSRVAWMAAVTSAAALVALAVLALDSFTLGDPAPRAADELHFVVHAATEREADDADERTAPPPLARARPYGGRIDLAPLRSGDSPSPTSQSTERRLELFTSFDSSLDQLPGPSVRDERFRIESDRSRRDGDRLVYRGNVRVDHERFRIEASEVEVPVPDADAASNAPALVARGVTLDQRSPSRTARAERLEFDPVERVFVLSGLERLDTAEGVLEGFGPEARLVITGEGFAIGSRKTNAQGASEGEASTKHASSPPETPK